MQEPETLDVSELDLDPVALWPEKFVMPNFSDF